MNGPDFGTKSIPTYGVPLVMVGQKMYTYLPSTVCMPKAKCAFCRSNPFELKLCEAQDPCNIRAHTKFQLLKVSMVANNDGSKLGVFCVVKDFLCTCT